MHLTLSKGWKVLPDYGGCTCDLAKYNYEESSGFCVYQDSSEPVSAEDNEEKKKSACVIC